jgi:predicted DNA binding protein
MALLQDEPYHVDLELTNTQCKCSGKLHDWGISDYKVVDVRGVENQLTRHLISISSVDRDKIPDDSVVRFDSGGDKSRGDTLVCFESEGCDVCKTVMSRGSFLMSGSSVGDSKYIYNFIAPNSEAYQLIIADLESIGLEPRILRIEPYKSTGKVLTAKQEKVLWLAIKLGFFDVPRKIHTRELSKKLGISMSTFSEITRRGMKDLLASHFDSS